MDKRYKRDDFHAIIRLSLKQRWLLKKEEELKALLEELRDEEKKDFIISLLENFDYLDSDIVYHLIKDIAEYIIDGSSFEEERTQLLSMTYDDEADSGQKILDQLKMPLFREGWSDFKTVNVFGKSVKNYKKGRNQIVIVDEFIGSGQTVINRVDYLTKNLPGDFEYVVCVMAGMKHSIDKLLQDGYKIFCPLQLHRGISDYYDGDERERRISLMRRIEDENLAEKIKNKFLNDYILGYGQAESLYSLEGANGNTPNSVFPIFWWKLNRENSPRKTLLTRYETGL